MQYFWETVESLKAAKIKNVGFEHFDLTHMFWLVMCLAVCVLFCVLYRGATSETRKKLRIYLASVIVVLEVIKLIGVFATGSFTIKYLPLHLCSINIFIIAIHAFKPTKTLDNFLYLLGIPGAFLAMLIPTWTELPIDNFMHIFSFGMHVFLLAYPIMVTVGGDIKPELRHVPKVLALLILFAAVAYAVNSSPEGQAIRPNFMFLQSASDIAPLRFFKKHFGTHLVAFPVILAGVIAIFYAPPTIWRYVRKKKQ